MISPVVSNNLLRPIPRAIAVTDDLEPRLDLSEKLQRRLKASSVAEQRHRLADSIPRGAERGASSGRASDYLPGSLMVSISWIETCLEERCVVKQPGWESHHRLELLGP